MKQHTSQILFQYWNDVRGNRMAPDRFDIEPARIATILPETCILERTDDGDLRFRLAGTRICDAFGCELRGLSLFKLVLEADRGMLDAVLHDVTSHGAVGLIEIEAACSAGRAVTFEAILLPLLHLQSGVKRYLGAISPIDPPAWLGTAVLASRGMTAHSIVWPDGRPHSLIARSQRQAPFLPALASARVVRVDRRQFRVVEGGRTAK
jgi:hypothetical protein